MATKFIRAGAAKLLPGIWLLGCALACNPALVAADTLADAKKQLLTGKYAEAEEAFAKLAETAPVEAALGVARCQRASGEPKKAVAGLTKASAAHPKAAALPAELAQLAFERGDYKTADEQVAAALKLDKDQLLARWIAAELHRVRGELQEADADYKWFVEYFNKRELKDPDQQRLVGLAAAQFARWNRVSDQFNFLVNDFYPDCLAGEPAYWPAHYEAGRLFLEKYNDADASKEFKAALALNPNAAEVHAAVAELALQNYELKEAQAAIDRALEIDSTLPSAHRLQADIHLANFEAQKAIDALRLAQQYHPTDEETLGRLAAAFASVDGLPADLKGTRCGKLIDEATARNPHCGEFFAALAEGLDKTRRFPAAAQYFQQATQRMPQFTSARGKLGLVLMRLGDEAQAKKVLDESFEVDPFNVRVSNTLKVLEVLDGYETLQTPHFIIKFDPKKDKILARYAARWLEEVYPQLCKQLGFEPPEKSLFEIFNKAKNTDGHGWFSARMVGLPHIHTIGACAGKMVAMQSPNDGAQKFNWARVLKHEFVHVVNLQQTGFNIPHWYTEALAVLTEGYPRPASWNELLAERVPEGKLFNLDTINLGFIRARSGAEWNLAYCQAELYAEYMLEKYGADALAKMLSAYADNLTTADALKRSFGVEQADFEKGYLDHVKKLVAGLPSSRAATKEMTLGQLQRALEKDPKNADTLAKVADAHLARKAYPEARKLAVEALKIDPKHQVANYVRARLHLVVGENEEAVKLLDEALDEQAPQENLLALLAGIRLKSADYAAAAKLYELGAKRDPENLKWQKSLAVVYLKQADTKRLAQALEKLANAEADDLTVRKKLAELALEEKDFAAAEKWANQALQIDVMDAGVHHALGQALIARDAPDRAIEEYRTALEIEPDDVKYEFGLASAYLAAKQTDKARSTLERVLKLDPQHAEAKKLLEGLKS